MMKKIGAVLLIGWLFILLFTCCAQNKNLNSNDAIECLTEHLILSNIMKDDLKTEDGKTLEWITDEMKENKVDKKNCYIVDLRFSDKIEQDMAGRLVGSYAVSKDGNSFYLYNPSTDRWETI